MPLLIGNQTRRSSSSTSGAACEPPSRCAPEPARAATSSSATGLKHATRCSVSTALEARAVRRRSCSTRYLHRGANGHEAGGLSMLRGCPAIGLQLLAPADVEPRDALEQPQRVRVARRGEDLVGRSRSRRTCRRTSRCTRSHIPATTPRSCVIRISAVSAVGDERPQQIEDLRLDRHVERGRRLVGDQELRLAGERHRDHRALAHATGELVRVVPEPGVRARDADLVEQLGGARSAAFLPMSKCATSASRSCRPIVSTGFRLVIGSWKIIATSLPRIARSWRSRRATAGRCPANIAFPPVTPPARGRIPSSASAVTLLPQPDSPTIPSVSPGADRERDAVDCVDRSAIGA